MRLQALNVGHVASATHVGQEGFLFVPFTQHLKPGFDCHIIQAALPSTSTSIPPPSAKWSTRHLKTTTTETEGLCMRACTEKPRVKHSHIDVAINVQVRQGDDEGA